METTGIYIDDGKNVVEKQISLSKAKDIYKERPEQFYSEHFFSKMRKSRAWQVGWGEQLAQKFKLNSVVDFGCASGFYLEGFLKGGSSVRGFEYLYDNAKSFMDKSVIDFIQYGNVMNRIDCGKFDCAISIEVAEHILPEKSAQFLDNLVNASNKLIMMTAATPGQKGTGHINEREREFWVNELKSRGFVWSEDDIQLAKECFDKLNIRNKYMSLIRKQIMVFRKDSE